MKLYKLHKRLCNFSVAIWHKHGVQKKLSGDKDGTRWKRNGNETVGKHLSRVSRHFELKRDEIENKSKAFCSKIKNGVCFLLEFVF